MFKVSIRTISEVTFKANRVYCERAGLPYYQPWEEIAEDIKLGFDEGVRKVLENPEMTPEETHKSWLEFRRANGWKKGDNICAVAKTHTHLVPFDDLPPSEVVKNRLFIGIVKAFAGVSE